MNNLMTDIFPPLPIPIAVEDQWIKSYPAPSAPRGSGQVQVIRVAADDGSTIVLVANAGDGVSVTNAAEDLRTHLDSLIAGPLHVIELWPAEDDEPEHFDRVAIVAGKAVWQRLHPTAPEHPRHAEYGDSFFLLDAVLRAAGLAPQ